MKVLIPIILLLSAVIVQCGTEKRAVGADKDMLMCKYLVGSSQDFHRCENEEVVCYSTDNGLSCKWKSL